jgi:3-methyl-2-oxobutanoate hydroxymethyltransferase
MGHIGLTPQSIHQLGGHRVQGKTKEAGRQLLADALAVEQAGAFAIVLELVPGPLAAAITDRLHIPTIGIGAGAGCSGQVQVVTDTLGMSAEFTPKHARHYTELYTIIRSAAEAYCADVAAGTFPGAAESTRMDPATLAAILGPSTTDRPEMAEVSGGIPLDRDL